jgi:hypothetical protein
MKEQDLIRRFADLTDEALLARLRSGNLTDEAEALARAEAGQRGLELPREPEPEPQPNLLPPSDYVQLAGYLQPMEAYVLEGRLRAEGIHAHLVGVKTVEANPLWLNAMGGVRIFVPRSEYQHASEILAFKSEEEDELQDDLSAEPAEVSVERKNTDVDAKKHRWGWWLLMVPSLTFAAIWIVGAWAIPCPPSDLCGSPDEPAVGILIKLLWSVAGFGPAAFAIRYLGNRFRRPVSPVTSGTP